MRTALSALLLLVGGVEEWLPLCLAVLLHEGGHGLACLWEGIPLRGLRLTAAGAALEYDPTTLPYRAEARIAAAGPFAGLLGALAVLRASGRGFALFGAASLALSCVNLLPILPLDGGVILSAVLHERMDPLRADRWMGRLSQAGVIGLWAVAVVLQLRCGGNLSLLILSVWLLCRMGQQSYE